MEITLVEVHGIQVLLTGQIAKPGGYTFEAPTMLLMDALSQAGGITSKGSLRAVEVHCGEQTKIMDLYLLLAGGKLQGGDFLLRQGRCGLRPVQVTDGFYPRRHPTPRDLRDDGE